MDYDARSLKLHREHRGKLEIRSKVPLDSREDLSVAYTPGVAEPCRRIAEDASLSRELTIRGNTVAVVSDGSAVLGLGDIGPEAAMPVMEGKAILFKEFAGIDALPICTSAHSADELVAFVSALAPSVAGVNLEDIAAPKCFEVEDRLQDLGIPVFHDDQHGTAVVLLAALLNAARVIGKAPAELSVVINGAGAAGVAIAKLLRCVDMDPAVCVPVRDVVVCDSKGAVHAGRDDLNPVKRALLAHTNRENRSGGLSDVVRGADVFIGVSVAGALSQDAVRSMAPDPIILAMANPDPEIHPDEAMAAGAAIVGTGRSDFPNQVNNVLAFPGIFRGALDARATSISAAMKLAAAHALAGSVPEPSETEVLPSPLDRTIAGKVAAAVAAAFAADTPGSAG
ncbi:MAG: NADP-dependent malic enzyme [Planctomycetota bacterium]